MARKRRNLYKGATVEETPEFIIYRYPDGTEVKEVNLKLFFSDPEKPKEPPAKAIEPEKPKKTPYQRDWNAYDEAQCQEVALFMKLMADLCSSIRMPLYEFGRPRLPYSDMTFAAALKVYSTKSCRRFNGYMDDAVKQGYMEKPCHYSSISNFMCMEELTPILHELIEISSLPIAEVDMEREFAVDSTGFSTSNSSRYFSVKHGKEMEERGWVKSHVCCGTKTKIVTEARITDNAVGDSPQFKPLVEGTAKRFDVDKVSADKAYSSRSNLQFAENIGAQAFIPFKKNTKSWALGAPAWRKMFHYFKFKQEEFMQHYHKRSNVESAFHMIKSKFSENLRSKDQTAQFNEVLLKILCHNICVVIREMHELGIDPKFFIDSQPLK